MNTHKYLICFTLMFKALTALAQEAPKEPFDIQARRVIFRLEHEETISRKGQVDTDHVFRSDGTGFVVADAERLYLVTARHVAAQKFDLRARVPSRRIDTGATEVIELRLPKGAWVFHDEGPSIQSTPSGVRRYHGVDVAVAPLPGIKNRAIVKFMACRQCPENEKNQLATEDPAPPMRVFIAGFPGDLGFEVLEQRPFFRSGIVAYTPGPGVMSASGAFVNEKCVVVDGKSEGGNSGSPVFSMSEFNGQITLVGLVIASNPATDVVIVEPASHIWETLEKARASIPSEMPSWHLLGSP